jgi:hypothetical protein
MMVDAAIVRAHQHSAGARKKTAHKRSAARTAAGQPEQSSNDNRV